MKIKNQISLIKIAFVIVLLIVPWSLNNYSEYDLVELNDENLQFYKSNTCKFSFTSFYIENISHSNIEYNFDNLSTIRCFGKINGVDKVGESFKVYIGANVILNLILQSLFWLTIVSFIKKEKSTSRNKYSFFVPLVGSLILVSQFFGENNFFENTSKNLNLEINTNNYYLLSLFLIYYLLLNLIEDVVEPRTNKIVVYFPFFFLFSGTYLGTNISFFLIVLVFYSLKFLPTHLKKINTITIGLLITFSSIWLTSVDPDKDYFFDPDKLRGLVNTSYTLLSQSFWIFMSISIVFGLNFIFSKNIDIEKLINNFLISGTLIVFLGFLGSQSKFMNLFNYFIFGQNKRGMKTFQSIEGNTWRGFSPSAEAAGEYFGFVILLYFLFQLIKNKGFNPFHVSLLSINAYGLYRSNNFAAIILLIFFLLISYLYHHQKIKIRTIIVGTLIIVLIVLLFPVSQYGYSYVSKHLLLQATSYSDIFINAPDYENADRFFKENDIGTILLMYDNQERMSNSLLNVINLFTQGFNFPFFPNIVAIASLISIIINRSELWGIFIAKYNPEPLNFLFGYGPFQFNEYYFGHKIIKIDGLILPHSSILDLLIFFGLFGILFCVALVFRYFIKNNYFYGNLLIIFLLINILKSDSILYLPSLSLIFLAFKLSPKIKEIDKHE